MTLNERRVWNDGRARQLLRAAFDAAVQSADPRLVVHPHLPQRPTGRCIVVGAGKLAAAMAAAIEEAWPDVALSGVVFTSDGNGCPTRHVEVVETAHPVAAADGARAGRRILALVQGLRPDDLVLTLLSGGGAALLALPADGITLVEKQAVGRALLAAGASIVDIERARAHLSAIKGGRLAQAARPARVVTLAIGDDPEVLASGPTMAVSSARDDIAGLIARFGRRLPVAVVAALQRRAETAPAYAARPDFRLIASPALALQAAAAVAQRAGIAPLILGVALEGESREVGAVMAGIARSVRRHGHPLPERALLLSGGTTTVTPGAGRAGRHGLVGGGGRNTEFLLGLALALSGEAAIWALAGATDGSDGAEDAAGAFVAPDTLERAREAGLDPRAMLSGHDSARLFDVIGDQIRTGSTRTDVHDFRAILIA